jgi:hypothetical protein
MWRHLVERCYPDHEFRPPASESVLTDAERRLSTTFPQHLRDLLTESDGVFGGYGLALVWPVTRIVVDNLDFRTGAVFRGHYERFDDLLFFGDAGNGDQFAFRLAGGLWAADVFAWDHEDDRRSWVAPDLRRYLEWWADGRLTL